MKRRNKVAVKCLSRGQGVRSLKGSLVLSLITVAVLVLPVVQGAVYAQERADGENTEMDLESLMDVQVRQVTSASRFQQDISEAPASVTIITAEEIRRYGYRNLAETLRAVTGFNITYDRTYNYLGVRGFGIPGDYNSRILLMVDGHRFNEPTSDSFFTGWGLGVDINNVSRIEIIRGPGSALYGANAMLATVNVITKGPQDDPGEELQLVMGEPDLTILSGRARGEADNFGYSLNLMGVKREGHHILQYPEFADPNIIDNDGDGNPDYAGFTVDNDEEKAVSLMARFNLGNFSLNGFYVDWDKKIPTASGETVFDSGEQKTNEGYYYLELRYDGQVGDHFDWWAKGSYDHYWYNGFYPYAYDYDYSVPGWQDPPYTIYEDDWTAGWYGLEFQGDLTSIANNRFIFGFEYFNNDLTLRSFDQDPAFIYEDDMITYYRAAVYLQDEISIGKRSNLTLGVNYSVYDDELFEGDVDRVNPRVGLVAGIGERGTIKALYGEAFRAPNMNELIYDDNGDSQIENRSLEAETLKTAELIYEHEVAPSILLKTSLYHTTFQNLIQAVEYDPVGDPGVIQYQNITDDVASNGLELELRKFIGEGFSGFVALALQETENSETGEELPNSPNEMVDAGVSIPLTSGKIYLSVDASYVGERKSRDLTEEIDPYVVTNATISHNSLARNLEMSVSVYNLFNVNYGDPVSFDHVQVAIQQDTRTFGLQLKYIF